MILNEGSNNIKMYIKRMIYILAIMNVKLYLAINQLI
jgi:hypothetical protein